MQIYYPKYEFTNTPCISHFHINLYGELGCTTYKAQRHNTQVNDMTHLTPIPKTVSDCMWSGQHESYLDVVQRKWAIISHALICQQECNTYIIRLCLWEDFDFVTPLTMLIEWKWFLTIVFKIEPSSSSTYISIDIIDFAINKLIP